jgi:putative transposase
MPRQPRLDAPNALHHVMVRGIERTALFRDETDRTDFVARLAALAEQGAWTVYAWALLPNHAHLLVRTGRRSLPRSMRSLLTGYAGAFNRRHRRGGHLFQNRYRSIVVEEEPYLLELVRYLHLNPLRAKLTPTLRTLDRFPWTGHSALLGTRPRPWQDTTTILAHFGPTRRRALAAYRAFVAAGIPQGRRPELQGGGLLRSHGGWAGLVALRRGREAYWGDVRVLGSSAFVAQCQQAAAPRAAGRRLPLATLVARVCQHVGLPPTALQGGGRTSRHTRARAGIAYLWTEVLGRPGRPLAPVLGIFPAAVYKAARRGAAEAAAWQRLLGRKRQET